MEPRRGAFTPEDPQRVSSLTRRDEYSGVAGSRIGVARLVGGGNRGNVRFRIRDGVDQRRRWCRGAEPFRRPACSVRKKFD